MHPNTTAQCVAGGLSDLGCPRDVVEAFDQRTLRWETLHPLLLAVGGAAGTSRGQVLYVLGGTCVQQPVAMDTPGRCNGVGGIGDIKRSPRELRAMRGGFGGIAGRGARHRALHHCAPWEGTTHVQALRVGSWDKNDGGDLGYGRDRTVRARREFAEGLGQQGEWNLLPRCGNLVRCVGRVCGTVCCTWLGDSMGTIG